MSAGAEAVENWMWSYIIIGGIIAFLGAMSHERNRFGALVIYSIGHIIFTICFVFFLVYLKALYVTWFGVWLFFYAFVLAGVFGSIKLAERLAETHNPFVGAQLVLMGIFLLLGGC
jgi:hypothetical protein